MKVIQHTLRESVIVGLVFPWILWAIIALVLAICAAFRVGQSARSIHWIFTPDFALICIVLGVPVGFLYSRHLGTRVEVGEGRIVIRRRNGEVISKELSRFAGWKNDWRRGIAVVRLEGGEELELPRFADFKLGAIRSAINAELALMQSKADGAN